MVEIVASEIDDKTPYVFEITALRYRVDELEKANTVLRENLEHLANRDNYYVSEWNVLFSIDENNLCHPSEFAKHILDINHT